jgi:hypothetical protein
LLDASCRCEFYKALEMLLRRECASKQSYQAAIIAQVAITALSLESLSQANWTAKAAFVASLVTGCLSVYFACTIQQQLNQLSTTAQMRMWLSKANPKQGERRDRREGRDESKSSWANDMSRLYNYLADVFWKLQNTELATEIERERVPSVNVALMLTTPTQLLTFSLSAFLVGLGVYLGFIWSHNLDPETGKRGSGYVLIVYVAFTVLALMTYYIPAGLKYGEVAKDTGEVTMPPHSGNGGSTGSSQEELQEQDIETAAGANG